MSVGNTAGDRILCEQCGRAVPMADIDLGRMLAKCLSCERVFSFADRFPGAAGLTGPVKRPPVARPKRFRITDEPYNKSISYRWWTPVVLFLTFFCIAWDGFLLFWYTAGIAGILSGKSGGAGWIMILFPIAHVAVGVGLTYFTLCTWINRTTITVSDRSLKIRHAPLPWRGSRTFPVTEFVQFYVESKTYHTSGTPSTYYTLKGVTYDGTQIKLIANLQEVSDALYLEQQLEKWMGIEDQPVAGEVSRQ